MLERGGLLSLTRSCCAVLWAGIAACSGASGDPNDGAEASAPSAGASDGMTDPGLAPSVGNPGVLPPSGSTDVPSMTDPMTTGPSAPLGSNAPQLPVDPANPTPSATPSDPLSEACATAAPAAGDSVLRRLTRLEYQLSVQELLQLPAAPAAALIPEDPKYQGFRTVSTLQTISTQHLRGFADEAQQMATALLADTARRDVVLGCDVSVAGCLDDFTARFGRLAYRRALTADEVAALTTRATEFAESPDDEFAFVIEALLTSPNFLFRIEVGESAAGLSTLSSAELASKLSFSVLGRTPDDGLLTRGESGEFATPEGLAAAANELVQDPRAQQYFNAFFRQWLDFEQLRSPPVPPEGWSDDLLPQMVEETELVLNDFAWGGGDFFSALSANYSYVHPELASFYGVEAAGGEAVRVDFAADHPRANTGLLTHASLIGAKGDGDIIAHRGKWLMGSFLCQNLELPAGLLDSLGDELEGLTRTEMLSKRNQEDACKACHSIIDPIGIGFAQFDSTGRFDPSVSLADFPLSPALAGSDPPEFASLAELATKLQAQPRAASCLTERVFLYTQGRTPLSEDDCGIANVNSSFVGGQRNFRELLLAMVTAPEFRLRKAPEASSSEAVATP